MKIFSDNSKSIGNTPLIKINNITKSLTANVVVKTEGRNPAYSIKCRVGTAMIEDAEKKGLLFPAKPKAKTVIEPTSGNTGIALAFTCAAKGYPLILTMPETMSVERRKMLAAFGAQIILTEGSKGMNGAIDKATEIATAEPEKYFMPQQFKNPANPQIHFDTTGPEIWNDTDGAIDILVSGVGTGGTISGISKYIKQVMKKKIVSIAVEPTNSAVLTEARAGKELRPGPHKIQGIGAGFIPETLDMSMIDEVITVTDDEAITFAKRLHSEEGITCGISGGAAMAAAYRVASIPENSGKTIVVILPDSGERYLSTVLFENS